MEKILNQSQAKAVADAMCALNNVDGKISITIPHKDQFIHVNDAYHNGTIEIYYGDLVGNYLGTGFEKYADQADFMKVYGV